jgi:hypothetical protein
MLEVIEDGPQMYLPYKLHINFIKTRAWSMWLNTNDNIENYIYGIINSLIFKAS